MRLCASRNEVMKIMVITPYFSFINGYCRKRSVHKSFEIYEKSLYVISKYIKFYSDIYIYLIYFSTTGAKRGLNFKTHKYIKNGGNHYYICIW